MDSTTIKNSSMTLSTKPVVLQVSFETKHAWLIKWGYEIRKETINLPSSRAGNYVEDEPHISYRVYRNGEDVLPWALQPGSYCVDWVFQNEFSKKLLSV